MKTIFTFKSLRYFALIFIMAFLSLNLNAQTTFNVDVSNYKFNPANLTITAGDKVIWTNSLGTHNVDGLQSAFPSNPESFGNSLGAGWTYQFVFNTAGTYNYHCDPHAAFGMVGKVIVNPKSSTSIQAFADGSENIRLYPNPASQYINLKIPANYSAINSLKVYSITGAMIDQKAFPGNAESFRYDISRFNNGIYFMEINTDNHKDVLKFLKQ